MSPETRFRVTIPRKGLADTARPSRSRTHWVTGRLRSFWINLTCRHGRHRWVITAAVDLVPEFGMYANVHAARACLRCHVVEILE